MNITRRRFILGLALSVGAQKEAAAKPSIFDFYEYVQKLKASSDKPNEPPWIPAMVRIVDRTRRQIRIMHVPAPSVGMPAMTMMLHVAETVDLAVPKVGRWVDIKIAKRNDRIESIELRSRGRCRSAACPP